MYKDPMDQRATTYGGSSSPSQLSVRESWRRSWTVIRLAHQARNKHTTPYIHVHICAWLSKHMLDSIGKRKKKKVVQSLPPGKGANKCHIKSLIQILSGMLSTPKSGILPVDILGSLGRGLFFLDQRHTCHIIHILELCSAITTGSKKPTSNMSSSTETLAWS